MQSLFKTTKYNAYVDELFNLLDIDRLYTSSCICSYRCQKNTEKINRIQLLFDRPKMWKHCISYLLPIQTELELIFQKINGQILLLLMKILDFLTFKPILQLPDFSRFPWKSETWIRLLAFNKNFWFSDFQTNFTILWLSQFSPKVRNLNKPSWYHQTHPIFSNPVDSS